MIVFFFFLILLFSGFWQSVSVSDWSKPSASGDAAGEVEGVYLERKKFSKFVSKALFI